MSVLRHYAASAHREQRCYHNARTAPPIAMFHNDTGG
jgi:hypothetical protein